jgi:hypothetical protein
LSESPAVTPQTAASELLKRRRARTDLVAFTQYTRPGWYPSKLHRAVAEALEAVHRREVDRLMIMCPPQFGKSVLSSKSFPTWSLGHDPHRDVASISATASLATEFGRDVRNTAAGRECRNVFKDLELAEDSQAAGRWHTKQGGSFLSLGIGGQFFGRGADLAVIDDPFASWEDAQRELERERVWDWYTGTLYNRVRPGGAIVLIQHRLHEADLVGRLLERQKDGGDKWTVVELKADADLWPERYDAAALERIRVNTSPIKWSALYMQNPMPEEGTFFKREWFELFDPAKLDKAAHKYITSDFAVTQGDGDFTEIGTHGYLGETLYLGLDGWYGQTSADVWIEQCCEQIKRHRPFCFFGEMGVIRRSVEPFLVARMRERQAMCRIEWLPRTKDKASSALGLQGLAAMGRVKIADTPYGHRLLGQMLRFPGGQLDDAVDMAALMGMAIDQAHPGIAKGAPKPMPKRDGYLPRPQTDSWKVA